MAQKDVITINSRNRNGKNDFYEASSESTSVLLDQKWRVLKEQLDELTFRLK